MFGKSNYSKRLNAFEGKGILKIAEILIGCLISFILFLIVAAFVLIELFHCFSIWIFEMILLRFISSILYCLSIALPLI